MSRRLAAYLFMVLITAILVWTHFSWPIFEEETDYVRFALWALPDQFWLSEPFYLADGHTPLLSLLMSWLLVSSSPLWARVVAFGISLGGMYFLFSWGKALRLPLWSTLLFGFFLLHVPIHRDMLTSMFSDFPGFVFLMGWAYFRHVRRPTPAMLCLLVACLMRETHILPAVLFVLVGWRSLNLRRTIWVELTAVLILALYYSWSKLVTGFWYPFNGRHAIDLANLTERKWPYATLPIVIPLVLTSLLKFFPKKDSNKPLFFRNVFLVPLALVLITIFAPYLATFHKARLLTPFVSFYWLAFLNDWHHLKLGQLSKSLLLIFLLACSYAVHDKFVPRPRRAQRIAEARQIVQLAMELKLPRDSIVTGDWPHSMHLTFEKLGFIEAGDFALNRDYFPFRQQKLIAGHSSVPMAYFATDHAKRSKLFSTMCELGCEKLEILSPDYKIWTIYLRNIPIKDVEQARYRLWPIPNDN